MAILFTSGIGQSITIRCNYYGANQNYPFELGETGEYEAKTDGNLFVRCRDDWCEIADNTGAVTVKFKVAP